MAVYNKVGFIDKNTILKNIINRSITTLTAEDLNGLTSIGDYAFYSCESLTSIEIPNTVTTIGEGAFNDCTSLASVTLYEGLISIGYSAFRDTILTNITIPSTVTTIDSGAFYTSFSSVLTSVTMLPTIPPSGGTSWFSTTSLTAIYVPANSVNAYKNATGWSDYASYIQAIPE